jgi:hypothetical protein
LPQKQDSKGFFRREDLLEGIISNFSSASDRRVEVEFRASHGSLDRVRCWGPQEKRRVVLELEGKRQRTIVKRRRNEVHVGALVA